MAIDPPVVLDGGGVDQQVPGDVGQANNLTERAARAARREARRESNPLPAPLRARGRRRARGGRAAAVDPSANAEEAMPQRQQHDTPILEVGPERAPDVLPGAHRILSNASA